jgi:hypothetical protein
MPFFADFCGENIFYIVPGRRIRQKTDDPGSNPGRVKGSRKIIATLLRIST